MKRACTIIAILGFAVILAGCDKCGDPVKFFQPKSCGASSPQG